MAHSVYSIFTLGVPYDWPQRLLHIPSMTSRQWEPGNLYGDHKEPTYAILSYTWGRYEVAEGPRLGIKGIDWKVPSIRPDHFTVASFTSLLNQIGLEYEYVWVDIACIDQKREKAKMEEVGRQGIIFKRAQRAYVWLNKYEPEVIQGYLQRLMQCGYRYALGHMNPFETAEKMTDNLSSILQDPWFSSLWTLQESFLQRHATMMNKQGEIITTEGPWVGESSACQLMDISGVCAVARAAIDQAIQAENARENDSGLLLRTERLDSLRTIIDNSGLDFVFSPNPNILYAAARFRQTTRAEDRIYAIMQAYGYRLGNSAPSIQRLKKFGLEELELQFIQALNSQSVILGQAFQHLTEPASGQSWCITNHIRVPQRLQMIIVHEQFVSSTCVITIHSKSEAYFRGDSCTLGDLSNYWQSRSRAQLAEVEGKQPPLSRLEERNAYFAEPSRNYLFKKAKQGLIIDHGQTFDSTAISHEWPPDTAVLDRYSEAIIENRIPELTDAANKQTITLANLITRFGEDNIRVLYLGLTKYIEHMNIGLILVRQGSYRKTFMSQKIPIWRRIGIAFWQLEGDRGIDISYALKPKGHQIKRININSRVMIDAATFRHVLPGYPLSTLAPEPKDILSNSESESNSNGDDDATTDTESCHKEKRSKAKQCLIKDPETGEFHVIFLPVDEEGRIAQAERFTAFPDNVWRFSEEDYLIASPVVLGFDFETKMFYEFAISGITDIAWNGEAFDSLVLDEDQKSLIRALVESHVREKTKNIDDVIRGKGRGLVVVLHGLPGCGKTLTAESVAELPHKPLYSVSIRSIGTRPDAVEAKLEVIFDVANRWNALLLIDEADVFLEQRQPGDLHRNALVSIFLRKLEYFEGVLFLTTNRVNTFDEVFQSRVQIGIRYPKLETKARSRIFRSLIEKVRALPEVEVEEFTEEDYGRMSRYEWMNGREIKNIVRSAQSVALTRNEALSMKHFDKVLKTGDAFVKNLEAGDYELFQRQFIQ